MVLRGAALPPSCLPALTRWPHPASPPAGRSCSAMLCPPHPTHGLPPTPTPSPPCYQARPAYTPGGCPRAPSPSTHRPTHPATVSSTPPPPAHAATQACFHVLRQIEAHEFTEQRAALHFSAALAALQVGGWGRSDTPPSNANAFDRSTPETAASVAVWPWPPPGPGSPFVSPCLRLVHPPTPPPPPQPLADIPPVLHWQQYVCISFPCRCLPACRGRPICWSHLSARRWPPCWQTTPTFLQQLLLPQQQRLAQLVGPQTWVQGGWCRRALPAHQGQVTACASTTSGSSSSWSLPSGGGRAVVGRPGRTPPCCPAGDSLCACLHPSVSQARMCLLPAGGPSQY